MLSPRTALWVVQIFLLLRTRASTVLSSSEDSLLGKVHGYWQMYLYIWLHVESMRVYHAPHNLTVGCLFNMSIQFQVDIARSFMQQKYKKFQLNETNIDLKNEFRLAGLTNQINKA